MTPTTPNPRLRARGRRLARIRRAVAAAASAVFIALFGTIYVHVAKQDSARATSTSSALEQSASGASTSAGSASSADDGASAGTWNSGDSGAGSSGLGPVTTAQS